MKKLKKILSVILITAIVLSTFSISITVNAETTKQAEENPFSVEVTTNKSEYSTLGTASITVKITNTTDKTIENVSAEAVFDSLSPLGESIIKAETNILESGQSIKFTYDATLDKDFTGLNGLQKFFLAFKRLFYKKVSVVDNGFDNGRACIENSTLIKFGKFEVENIVRVWYTTDDNIENNPDSDYGKLTDSGACGKNILWEFYGETGTLVITGNGTLESADWGEYRERIKKIIFNGDITKISSWLFAGYDNLVEVQLPYSIKVISKYAFSNCISLRKISFPNGLIEIGEEAFNGCSSIESIILPNSLKTLGGRAFGGCSNANELSIGNGLTELPFSAFSDNTSLKSVVIPDNITSLGIYVFSGCKMLKKVTIGDGITVISAWAFQDCTNLQEVNFGKKICSTQHSAFGNCTSLKHIVLNDNFKELGQSTFENCIALKTISIPVSVTKLSSYVFSGCYSLSDIFYKGSQAEWESITKGGDYGNTDEILNHVTIHYNSK